MSDLKSGKDGNNYSIWTEWWNDQNRRNYKIYSAGNRWINARIKDIVYDRLIGLDIKTVTDVGSGDGSRVYFLSTVMPGTDFVGVDFAEDAVRNANGTYGSDKVKFMVADVRNTTIDSDMVTSFGVLEHIPNWQDALDSWLKSPKVKYFLAYFPVGRLRKNEKYVGHVNAFKPGEVENYLARGGWKTVEH